MGRNVDIIKECLRKFIVLFNTPSCHHLLLHIMDLEYKGPPDPLRGDEIYKRVRDAARVCAAFFFSFIHRFSITKIQT